MGMHPKIAILKQLQTHCKAKCEKGVGTPFQRVPAPLHPCFMPIYYTFIIYSGVYHIFSSVHCWI